MQVQECLTMNESVDSKESIRLDLNRLAKGLFHLKMILDCILISSVFLWAKSQNSLMKVILPWSCQVLLEKKNSLEVYFKEMIAYCWILFSKFLLHELQ